MDFRIRRGTVDDIDRLEPLWRALYAHHSSLDGMPAVRPLADSWAHRRAQYENWLVQDGYTLLLAEREGEPIGYAVISINEGAATWDLGERTAEIETLAVLEGERGSGVGKALTDAAVEVAGEAGVDVIAVGVAHTNADALRFYEREGYEPFYVLMIRRPSSSRTDDDS